MVSLLAAPAFTVIGELVLAVLVPSVMSTAVRVWEPVVLRVTLAVRVPADSAPLAGRMALESLAVTVLLPAVFKVTLKVCVPATKAAFAGCVSFRSLVLMPTVSVTVVTVFQLASTALTVALKGVPALWAVGVPVLPVLLPGAAV